MKLNSISSSPQLASVAGPQTVKSSAVDAAQLTEDSSGLSGPAELFKKLEALSKSDPAKFKGAVDDISKKLTVAAAAATDPQEKQMLSALAEKFTQAGVTGDVSALKPPQGSPPAGGKGESGASAGNAAGRTGARTKAFDPADPKGGGTASMQGQADHDAKQAARAGDDSTGLSAYKRVLHSAAEDKANALFTSLNSIVDSVASGRSAST